tara:strand:- start:176 stop:1036 length:861 start_codon:yes stop_codon:yes gene_type:complete
MKVLIYGGSGFLGRNLANYLNNKKHKVTVFDKKKIHFDKKNIKFIKGNILNLKQVKKATKGQDIVYNLAGISDIGDSIKDPISTTRINILGSVFTLEAAVKYKIKRYIFASSIYVLSRQGGFYKTSKQSVESFIEEYNKRNNLKYTILRYGSVYGPESDRRNGIKKIISSALKNKLILYGGTAKAERRFIHVNDAVKASEQILKKRFVNKRVLITGLKKIKIKKLVKKIKSILNINKKVLFQRKPMMGHYDKNPFNDPPKKQITFLVKPTINLESGIKQIINELRK